MKPTIAIVPVRAGSKGLVGKNVRMLQGEPLYMRSVKQGLEVAGRCIVNTDIEEIITAVAPHPPGMEVQERPHHLARDDTPMSEVLLEGLKSLEITDANIVLLQATSPLRSLEDIKAAIKIFKLGGHPLVFSVSETDSTLLKTGFVENNIFRPVSRMDYLFMNRQSLPKTYRPNGAIYVFDLAWFVANESLNTDKAGVLVMPPERGVDIDTIEDFKYVEAQLMKK